MYSLNNSGSKLIFHLRSYDEANTLTVLLDRYADIGYFTILFKRMFDIHSNIVHEFFLYEIPEHGRITPIGIKLDEESQIFDLFREFW